MGDVVHLPARSKPRPAFTADTLPSFEELLFDASADLPMGYFASDVVTGDKNPIEPRAQFGLAPARVEDRTAQDRVKAAARRARTAADAPVSAPPSPTVEEFIEKASDYADEIVALLRLVARSTGKPRFHLLAQDAEQLSERLCHALAEQS